MQLLDVIRIVKPTILLGLSATPGVFTETIIKTMTKNCNEMSVDPIIFALSNPRR